jgi:glycosyltransferase involved in cell wall biosynthesis
VTSGRLRLLHFALDGDTSGYFPQLARHFDRSSFDMVFGTLGRITPELRAVMETEKVPVVSLDAGSRWGYPLIVARLAKVLRRHRVDIFHAHLFDPSVVGLVAARLAGIPVSLVTRHYSDYHTRLGKRWHVRLDQMCTALSHGVIAVSEQTRRVMVEEEKAPPQKVRVVYNGIDLDRVSPPEQQDVERLREELGVAGCPVIVVVARLHPEKGHTYLFRAMPAVLAGTGGRARLLVVGEGSFRPEFEREVAELGVAHAVRFLGFRRDVVRLFCLADVVVLPSLAEAFGLVLVEAMALRRPIVATRVGGIPELIEHGQTGWLVEPGSPSALAEGILALLNDRALCERLRESGRARALERFRFETMMQRYEEYYRQLARERIPGLPP